MPQNLFPAPVLTPKSQICKTSNFPSLLSPLSSDASPLPTPVLKTTFILDHSIHSTSPTTCKKNIFIFDFFSFFSFYFFADLGWLLANLGTKKNRLAAKGILPDNREQSIAITMDIISDHEKIHPRYLDHDPTQIHVHLHDQLHTIAMP